MRQRKPNCRGGAGLWPSFPRAPLVIDKPRLAGWQLAGLEREWKQLQREARPSNPFLSWEWQTAWAEHHRDGSEPLVAAETFPDGRLSGLIALQRVRRRGWRRLEFLGDGSGGDELDCLLHPAAPPEVAPRLLSLALSRARSPVVQLRSARSGGACAGAWHWLGHSAGQVRTDEWLPVLPLPATLDELLATHSANFRAEVRRRRRTLMRKLPAAYLECAHTPQAVRGSLAQLFRLHNLRRAQQGDRGIFETAALREFHVTAATRLAGQGRARVYLLRTANDVIAGLYGFEAERRFLYFQSGFDPAHRGLSPGTVLLSAVMEDCMRRQLREFEFLRGEEGYKGRWTRQGRASVRLEWTQGAGAWMYRPLRELLQGLQRGRSGVAATETMSDEREAA